MVDLSKDDLAYQMKELLQFLSADSGIDARLRYNPKPDKPQCHSYLLPILAYMENCIDSILDSDMFSESACMDICRNGLHEIALIFSKYTLGKLNERAGYFFPQAFEDLSEQYDGFCQDMLGGGLESAFSEYPMLGRMVMNRINRWVDSIIELHDRISADYSALSDALGCEGQITALTLSIGIKQNGGRSVTIIKFENETKIVYRPKSSDTDTAFRAYADFLSEIGAVYSMRTPKLLSRGDYSYAEFIDHLPITEINGTEAYFTRTGQLLCMLYALGANDIHRDNVIACGEFPVVIDTEIILSPVCDPKKNETITQAQEILNSSVASTGMLLLKYEEDTVSDIGGIPLDESAGGNAPLSADGIDYDKSFEFVLSGFEKTYKAIMQNKNSAMKALNVFSKCKLRYLFRKSQIYRDMLVHITSPEYMKSEQLQNAEIARLYKACNNCGDEAKLSLLKKIVDYECDAIREGDIPTVYAQANGLDIYSANAPLVSNFFDISPIGRATSIISKFSQDDLKMQLMIIKLYRQCKKLLDNPGDYLKKRQNNQLSPDTGLEGAIFDEIVSRALK